MINCKKVLERLEDLVDGSLSPKSQQIIEQHVSQCQKCDAVVNNYKIISKILDDMGGSSVE